MKNLKKILAENMLRFGTKNINPEQIQHVLSEQTIDQKISQRNAAAIDKTQGGIANVENTKSLLDRRRTESKVTFIKTAKTEKLPLDPFNINAVFYNNMVSLSNGLMTPKSEVDAQISEIVSKLVSTPGLEDINITVTGTATTAAPKMSGYKDKKTPIPLDHPGKPYGGIDISKPENYQSGNEYLAKQRAQSIINELKSKLEQAGIKGTKFTAASKILTGTFDSNELRYLKVDITANQKTNKIITTATVFLNFSVSYETGQGTTQAQGVNKIQQRAQPGQTDVIDQTKQDGYKASISISFGQTDPGLTFEKGFLAKDLVSTGYNRTAFPDVPNQSGGSEINAKSTMTPSSSTELFRSATSDVNGLNSFLSTCGRFTPDQVKTIIASLTNIKSPLFKSLTNKQGDFDEFVRLAGGTSEARMGKEYGVTQILDKTKSSTGVFVAV